MKSLFEKSYENFKDRKDVKIEDIKKLITEEGLFDYLDLSGFSKSDEIKYGKIFKKFIGRILSGIKLICYNPEKQNIWRNYAFIKENGGSCGNGKLL
jgi:hypothetical protein